MILTELAGEWTGNNGFRLMPHDPLVTLPATAALETAAGGHLTLLRYTWQHPDDGPQDGLLVIGSAGEAGSYTGLWVDTWHQQPVPMSLPGSDDDGQAVTFQGDYGGGWGWHIRCGAVGGDALSVRMDNVVPAHEATGDVPAGAYPAMVMDLQRA